VVNTNPLPLADTIREEKHQNFRTSVERLAINPRLQIFHIAHSPASLVGSSLNPLSSKLVTFTRPLRQRVFSLQVILMLTAIAAPPPRAPSFEYGCVRSAEKTLLSMFLGPTNQLSPSLAELEYRGTKFKPRASPSAHTPTDPCSLTFQNLVSVCPLTFVDGPYNYLSAKLFPLLRFGHPRSRFPSSSLPL
jgi:hypothetical protein